MAPTLDDDHALLRRMASGDPAAAVDALESLYDRHSRLIFSVALAMLGDRPTAEEVTLDVFVRVWRAVSTYRSERASVRTWLVSITRHHAIDVLRWRNSHNEHKTLALDDLPPLALQSTRLEDPAQRGDPQADLELSTERRRVRLALASLPEDQRQALTLAYFKGLSHSQIAELLGQPLGTVKTRIRLALTKLRAALADDGTSGGE